MHRPPVGDSGVDTGGRPPARPFPVPLAASSAIVRPVTVMASPFSDAHLEEAPGDELRAAGLVQVGRDEPAGRLEVREPGHRRAHRG